METGALSDASDSDPTYRTTYIGIHALETDIRYNN